MLNKYYLVASIILILLSGCVPSSNKSIQAERPPVIVQYDDIAVNQQIKDALEQSGSTDQVTALCIRGEVFLIGYLADADFRKTFVAALRNDPRVIRVVTGWSIEKHSAEDVIVLENVRKKLLGYSKIRVALFDGVIVLIGQCQSADEMDKIVDSVKSTPRVEQIVNYLRVRD